MTERVGLAAKITRLGLVANLFLTGLKLLAGLLGHSSAMVADAFHSLSDLLSDFVVLAGFKLANKPADKSHPYGHGKIETFVALIMGALLLFVALGIATNAVVLIRKIIEGQNIAMPKAIALIMAFVSIVVKEILFRKTINIAREIDSAVLLANAWHHRSDALSSVAAFLGIAGAYILGPKFLFLDPLAAFAVAAMILKLAHNIAYQALNELLEASLCVEDTKVIKDCIINTQGVMEVHGLRTRRLGPVKAVEAHICVDPNLSVVQGHDIATAVELSLKQAHGQAIHIAIHVEPYGYK